jgi:hypothetical protein
LSNVTTWRSCAPPRSCSSSEEATKRRNGQERLAAWRKRCAGQRVTIPPDKDPVCGMQLASPNTIVVHQTESAQGNGPDFMQTLHKGQGWDDVGYNFVISKTKSGGWRVFEGRIEGQEGSHAGAGLNARTLGIAVSGDYRPGSGQGLPSPEAIMTLKSLIMHLKSRYSTINSIYGHGEFKRRGSGCGTDCPSPPLQQFVNSIRPEVR